MASRSSDGSDLVFPARGLSLAGSLFPIQLLKPAWQLKLGSALINASPFPLIGLGAMHLARVLDPADRLLRRRSPSPPASRWRWRSAFCCSSPCSRWPPSASNSSAPAARPP